MGLKKHSSMRRKSEVIRQAKKSGNAVCSLRDFDGPLSLEECRTCKHASWNTMSESCLGRDTVKNEEGYRSVFAEQGASESQMAAAKLLDTISKLLVWLGKHVTQFPLRSK